MSEPFRDEMSAALTRAEKLAGRIRISAKDLPPPLPPRRRSSGIGAGTLIIACFVCLFVGIMLGAMTR